MFFPTLFARGGEGGRGPPLRPLWYRAIFIRGNSIVFAKVGSFYEVSKDVLHFLIRFAPEDEWSCGCMLPDFSFWLQAVFPLRTPPFPFLVANARLFFTTANIGSEFRYSSSAYALLE